MVRLWSVTVKQNWEVLPLGKGCFQDQAALHSSPHRQEGPEQLWASPPTTTTSAYLG